jgi:hypothetical protein
MIAKHGVIAQCAVYGAPETTCGGLWSDGVRQVVLVEEGTDSVTLGDSGDLGASCKNNAGTVGSRDDREVDDERIKPLYDRVSVSLSFRCRSRYRHTLGIARSL